MGLFFLSAARGAQIQVDASAVINTCSPFLYGSCLEDLNHEVYGGLYDQRLYGESFEEPAPVVSISGWDSYGGQWGGQGGVISVAPDYGAKLVRSQPQFSDGTIELELRFPSRNSVSAASDTAGIVFRVLNPGVGANAMQAYEVSLSSDGRTMVLGKHEQNWTPLQNAAVSVADSSQWQKLKVVTTGGRIQIYLNGGATPVIDFTDPNPLPAGQVGLRDWNSDVQFRNFSTTSGGVTSPETFTGLFPARIVNWQARGGKWLPINSNTGVSVEPNPSAALVRQSPQFTDGTVDFDLRFTAPFSPAVNAGAILRAHNVNMGGNTLEGYAVNLSSDGKRLSLNRLQSGAELSFAVVSVDPSQWQHVSVSLAGGAVRVFLNQATTPQIDFLDGDPQPVGNVGLKTAGAGAQFKAFVTTAASGSDAAVFEGVPVYNISGAWDPVTTGTATGRYLLDSVNPYNSKLSQMVTFVSGVGNVGVANQGLNHWGIAVKQGATYPGRVYLRTSGMSGIVTVRLESSDGSKVYGIATLSGVTSGWSKFPFALTSNTTDPNARFSIRLNAPGTVWIDQAVLLGPQDPRYQGVPIRADIADAVQAGGLKFMRYGGSAANSPNYRWKDMIGDPDRRPQYNATWHDYTTNGFAIEEYVAFCRKCGLEPAFAVNIEETPQDMADMVEYLNGDAGTYWGAQRAANGHPDPYAVRFIELGNEEMSMPFNNTSANYDHYIARFKLLAAAMKNVDPNLLLVNAAWWYGNTPDCEKTFRALDGIADYWDFHFWVDEMSAVSTAANTLAGAKQMFQTWNPGTKMKAVVFEENGERHDLQRSLSHALMINMIRRQGDFVLADCEANAFQAWFQNDNGWDQGHLFFSPDKVWGMPNYHVQQMASDNYLPLLVSNQVTGGPTLDVATARSEDGGTLCTYIVNFGASPTSASVALSNFTPLLPTGDVLTISGKLKDANTLANPEAVVQVPSTVAVSNGTYTLNLPGYSYTIVRLTGAAGVTLDQRASNYAMSRGVPAASAGPSSDPDGDGLNNFTEWAFGTDPKFSDAELANLTLTKEDGITGAMTFGHRRLTDYVTAGVVYRYQVSPDLKQWTDCTPLEISSSRIVSNPAYEDVNFQVPIILTLGKKRLFLRISVAH